MKKVILWIMCISCLLLVVLSFVLKEQCGEKVCDIMRISGYVILLLFSFMRSAWRSDRAGSPQRTADTGANDSDR